MIHKATCVLCDEDKPCIRVEHLGPVCVDDIQEAAKATAHEEGSTG